MDALLPTLYYGHPILGYRGRFDPERAFHLMREVRRCQYVSLSDRAQDDDEGGAGAAATDTTSRCARIMSAGEAVGETVFAWSTRRARA